MSVGKNIKMYLESNGISQSFLSENTGIPNNTLSNMWNIKKTVWLFQENSLSGGKEVGVWK